MDKFSKVHLEIFDFKEYLEFTNNVMICVSPDLLITEFNSVAENIFNCQKNDVMAASFSQFCLQHGIESPILSDYKGLATKKAIPQFKEILSDGTALLWKIVRLFDEEKTFSGYMLTGKKIGNDTALNISINAAENNHLEMKLKKDREESDEQGRLAKIYLQNIIARIPGSIYWKDCSGKFIGCNEYVAKMAGVESPLDVIGKTDVELPWKEQAHLLREVDKEVMDNGVERSVEETSLLADGTLATFLTTKVPLRDDGNNVIGILGVSVDITERKQMEHDLLEAKEKAEAANRAKSEFLMNIAHDFTVPIHSLITFVSAGTEKANRKMSDLPYSELTIIAETLTSLVADIRRFARYDLVESAISAQDNSLFNPESSSGQLISNKSLQELISSCAKLGIAKREAECVYYLIRGMTAKQIGKTIGISYRTAEFYLDNAKTKLHCSTKSELIAKIFTSGVV